MLVDFGHRVRTAEDGVDGLEMLKAGAAELDIALVDIMMPRMTGDQAVRQYRLWEREHRRGLAPLRIYACTGNATSTDAAVYVQAGFDGCVSKPIYPHVFRSLLSENKALMDTMVERLLADETIDYDELNAMRDAHFGVKAAALEAAA